MLLQAKPIIDLPDHLLDIGTFDIYNPPTVYESPLLGDNTSKSVTSGSSFIPIDSFMPDDAFVIAAK